VRYEIRFPDRMEDLYPESKGYLHGVEVVTDSGTYKPVFYEPVRLVQDIEAEFGLGSPEIAIPDLKVVPTVTPDAIHEAVAHLASSGFEGLRPV